MISSRQTVYAAVTTSKFSIKRFNFYCWIESCPQAQSKIGRDAVVSRRAKNWQGASSLKSEIPNGFSLKPPNRFELSLFSTRQEFKSGQNKNSVNFYSYTLSLFRTWIQTQVSANRECGDKKWHRYDDHRNLRQEIQHRECYFDNIHNVTCFSDSY